ncbi:MAG: chromosomal replication initiator protein DnaA [Bacteroidales bacterium]|nr:chromosomal replication initiator protein DnaA [Bacteroidales bacterium]
MELEVQLYWKRCLDFIQDNIEAEPFKIWFLPIVPISFDKGNKVLTIAVPTNFFYEFLEEHYLDIMHAAIKHVFGEGVVLMYDITVDKENKQTTEVASNDPKVIKPESIENGNQIHKQDIAPQNDLDPRLNPNYSFNNFIEGMSNKLSRQIGLSVAEKPAHTTFNPLFIYGPSGVGKTHLVNAIGSQIKQRYPHLRVLYVSAHLFMVQYTESVRNNTFNDFMNFYQSIDVLIVDDMQELAGVTRTQNTFFHIFNHLHQTGKQLIMTADRSPVDMKGFEDRMLTRFKWGMLAELEKPTEELRKKILQVKIKKNGLDIPDDVVSYIAHAVNESVRDLEGIINSLMAYSVVFNSEIDMSLAEKVVGRSVKFIKKEITIEDIIQQSCKTFNVSEEDIYSQSRKSNVSKARQVAMYLAQKHIKLSLTRIGALIGHRNHATVLHSINLVNDQVELDKDFRAKVGEIELALKD